MITFTVTKFDLNIKPEDLASLQVVQIYDTACLLKHHGSFITLLSRTRSGLPASINVDHMDFNTVAGHLIHGVKLDFSHSSAWDPAIRPAGSLPANGLELDSFTHINKRPVPNLEERLLSRDDISPLLGFGPGLTPGGDDFIIGALNAACFFSINLFNKLRASVCGLLNRTTDLSRHYLSMAIKRRAAEDIKNLLGALLNNNREDIRIFTDRILEYGSTSGFYSLSGIRWALKRI